MSIHSILRTKQAEWHRDTKNGVELYSLYNDYTKKSDEFRRADKRWRETEERMQIDKKLNEEQRKRLEREKQTNAAALSERNKQIEKKKRYYFDARTRRWMELEQSENDRKINLTHKIEYAKKQTHKDFENVRKEAGERNEQVLHYKVMQSTRTKHQMKERDENYKTEVETMKKRAISLKRQEEKARENTNNAIKSTRKRHARQLKQNLKEFHDQERRHIDERHAIEAKTDKLSKQNQRELLSESNRNFRIEFERRSHLKKTRFISTLRWKRKYVTSLKIKMSKLSKKRDIEITETIENIAEVNVKTRKYHRRKVRRKQRAREKERKETIGNIVRRISDMNASRERATIDIIKKIRKIRRKNKRRIPKDIVQSIQKRIEELSIQDTGGTKQGVTDNIQMLRAKQEQQQETLLEKMQKRVNEICAKNPKYMANISKEREYYKNTGVPSFTKNLGTDDVSEWSSEQHDDDDDAKSGMKRALKKFEMSNKKREQKKIQNIHRKNIGKLVSRPRIKNKEEPDA